MIILIVISVAIVGIIIYSIKQYKNPKGRISKMEKKILALSKKRRELVEKQNKQFSEVGEE